MTRARCGGLAVSTSLQLPRVHVTLLPPSTLSLSLVYPKRVGHTPVHYRPAPTQRTRESRLTPYGTTASRPPPSSSHALPCRQPHEPLPQTTPMVFWWGGRPACLPSCTGASMYPIPVQPPSHVPWTYDWPLSPVDWTPARRFHGITRATVVRCAIISWAG